MRRSLPIVVLADPPTGPSSASAAPAAQPAFLNGRQWRFAVSLSEPRSGLLDCSPNVSAKLAAVAAPYGLLPAR